MICLPSNVTECLLWTNVASDWVNVLKLEQNVVFLFVFVPLR